MRFVHAIGHQAVEAGAFVDFVEMRQRLAFVEHARSRRGCVTGGRSALFSVPSTRSLAGSRSFSPCWYWMPIVCAAEVVGDAQRGDVHLALLVNLVVGQIAHRDCGPVTNFMPRSSIQRADGAGFVVARLASFRNTGPTG